MRAHRRAGRVPGLGIAAVAMLLAAWLAPIAGAPGAEAPASGGLAGQLLVASPEMGDPRFRETVILLVGHDREGAFGLIVNRPLAEMPLAEVLKRLRIEAGDASGLLRLHFGGPVEVARGFLLHSPDYAGEATIRVGEAFAMTASREALVALAHGRGPRRALFAFGYAGWGAGQLEAELAEGAWVTVPADADLVFGEDYAEKWGRAYARRRIEL